jgi:CO/xanthine dehydrogenase Mo-binding subunit
MRTLSAIVVLMLLAVASPALADTTASPVPAASAASSPVVLAQSRIDTMLRTGHADASWFSASFLAQLSVDKVDGVIANLTAALGQYQSVEYTPAAFVAHFAKGTDDVLIGLDADNKIYTLLFRQPSLSTPSP